MGKPITTDNFDDQIKNALRATTDEIIRRLDRLEKIVNEDLHLDKNQQDELPDNTERINSIYSKVDQLRNDLNQMRNEITSLHEKLDWLINSKNSEE